MNYCFMLNDAIHKIAAKFTPAVLPTTLKPFHLRAARQLVLDVHDIALKAAVYNIPVSPRIIEEGFTAAMELIHYLAADGYRIKTPLFSLSLRIPGQYAGSETCLPPGVFPAARLRTSAGFRTYLKERVQVEFDRMDTGGGFIAEARDEATGLTGKVMTKGNILTIYGSGLKVEGDGAHKGLVGVYFKPAAGLPVKASVIALNHPKTLRVLVPDDLAGGVPYHITVQTQSSAGHGGNLLKKVRGIRSDFTLTAAVQEGSLP